MAEVAALLLRAQEGDLEAFGEVVARFQDMAFGYALAILRNAEDARDAVQEAFLIAFRSLGDLREPERFAGWLRRIVLSTCRLIVRQRRRLVPMSEVEEMTSDGTDPARLAERAELHRAVQSAIGSLSTPNRTATLLYYIGGYSIGEVSEFLQVPTGTIKRRLHESRRLLKERMMDTIGEELRGQRLPERFRQQVLARIAHWERFRGTEEEKVDMVVADPEWIRLTEVEVELEPVSDECRAIRKCIASLEPCHEHYVENVASIVEMIGHLQPRPILDCGAVCEARRQQIGRYEQSLRRWLEGSDAAAGGGEHDHEVGALLGERTGRKVALVEHLVHKLADGRYSVYADSEEDFDRVESRIQHLEACNYNWQENLRIVLREIAAGERLFAWHTPDGYNAHGDCPDRGGELREMMGGVSAWAEGSGSQTDTWTRRLGRATPEKRWLAASLCKHVSVQHAKQGGDRVLPRPSL